MKLIFEIDFSDLEKPGPFECPDPEAFVADVAHSVERMFPRPSVNVCQVSPHLLSSEEIISATREPYYSIHYGTVRWIGVGV